MMKHISYEMCFKGHREYPAFTSPSYILIKLSTIGGSRSLIPGFQVWGLVTSSTSSPQLSAGRWTAQRSSYSWAEIRWTSARSACWARAGPGWRPHPDL